MAETCLIPGSFDPVTAGHMDIIRRAAGLYDRVVVAVAHNPEKRGCFPVEDRVTLLRAACAGLENVTVDSYEGLTVAYARAEGIRVMVRGLRAHADFDGELALARVNRSLAPEIETVFLPGAGEHAHISSSAVRELLASGASVRGFVPAGTEALAEEMWRGAHPDGAR